MPATEYTTEDQLVVDAVAYWAENTPTGVSDEIPLVHFRRHEVLPIPAIIVGHEGFEREKMKGMHGTGRVNFRVALRTDLDVMDADDHRAIAAALDREILSLSIQPGPFALTYLHAILREAPQSTIEDRRQITVLRYQVVATRCEPEEDAP
jgi:hypothetical protein